MSSWVDHLLLMNIKRHILFSFLYFIYSHCYTQVSVYNNNEKKKLYLKLKLKS